MDDARNGLMVRAFLHHPGPPVLSPTRVAAAARPRQSVTQETRANQDMLQASNPTKPRSPKGCWRLARSRSRRRSRARHCYIDNRLGSSGCSGRIDSAHTFKPHHHRTVTSLPSALPTGGLAVGALQAPNPTPTGFWGAPVAGWRLLRRPLGVPAMDCEARILSSARDPRVERL